MSRIPTVYAKVDAADQEMSRSGSTDCTPPRGASKTHRPARKIATDDLGDPSATPRWKRLLDLTCILVALPLLLPLLACIALFIKCVSPGPALFRQERVGYRGRRFVCLKFRTMFTGANTAVHEEYCRRLIASGQPMAKLDEDEDRRIIPCGQVLRSCGLDELPQFLNVVRGQMSLVGPRPCLPAEYDAYLPEQKQRFNTLPGLTGLWQVSGKNATTFTRMIEMDLEYIRHQTLKRDLSIMVRTVPVVLTAACQAAHRRVSRMTLVRSLPHRMHPGLPAGRDPM